MLFISVGQLISLVHFCKCITLLRGLHSHVTSYLAPFIPKVNFSSEIPDVKSNLGGSEPYERSELQSQKKPQPTKLPKDL